MSARYEELDWRQTPMGELSLRRRLEPSLRVDVYEVRLGDEFLMSSLFTTAEIELARLALARLDGDDVTDLDVLVGGLGLGYTAAAVLDDARVRRLRVVEAQRAVIEWHQRLLLPLAATLTSDPRCALVHGDFFATVAGEPVAAERWHAVLVDIDHTPTHLLQPSHAGFYTAQGLTRLSGHLRPGGVFGLWSDDPPDDDFVSLLRDAFSGVTTHVVTFANHHTDQPSTNTVYLAQRDHG